MNENKFDGIGKTYSQFRPSYPDEFINFLYTDIGVKKASIIADIGSGTGLLTNQLLEKGSIVYAVEPNADMRYFAETNLQKFSNFLSVNGTAENTKLDDMSVDFITVAQAFHWFNRENFKEECKRILKPNGKVILVWNSRDEKSELVSENDKINQKYCPMFKGFAGGMRGDSSEDESKTPFSDFFSDECEIKVLKNDFVFDLENFIGRNLSSSYALKENDDNYELYINALKSLFNKYSKDDKVTMSNFTRSYIGVV